MLKPLDLSAADRAGVVVTYSINRFEVYHADGWLMTAAQDKAELQKQLTQNQITDAEFDAVARRKYLTH